MKTSSGSWSKNADGQKKHSLTMYFVKTARKLLLRLLKNDKY